MGFDDDPTRHWARLADAIAQTIGHDNPIYQAARTASRTGRADHFVRANQQLQVLPEAQILRIRRLAESAVSAAESSSR